jgi:crotonobetainyl-CoA:carnitine CoA-transferase CaiB-like acyl-CoA transferase
MTAPLEGVRVVEIASYVAAPAAGALLADLGAEVIKVEIPAGEVYRHSIPRRLGYKSDFAEAPHFQMDNRGKRSLTLDLGRPAARRALDRVLDGADILLTNLLPSRLVRYALDAASLRRDRPALIVANLTGYGTHGADADRPGFDYAAYWARTGFMDLLRDGESPPAFLRSGAGDHAAALALCTGILAALRTRDRTGRGQTVGVSLLHIGFYILGNDAALALATGQDPPRHDRARARNPLWNHYRTSDDRWLFLVMIESQRYWADFCEAIGRDDLPADPRFEDAIPRYRNSDVLCALLAEHFAKRTLAEWETALDAKRLIWSPVRTLSEALHDEQARATGVFTSVDHPVAGTYDTVAAPIRLSGHAMPGGRPAPALGADAEAVLANAGLSPEEIREALAPQAD